MTTPRILVALIIGTTLVTTNLQAAPTIKGDLRYRIERIDQHAKKVRIRHRVRARLGAYGKVDDNASYGLRLASGSSDPVSTNQSLDGGLSSKGVNLDLAFIDYIVGDIAELHLGKYKNNFYRPGKSELIWDGDLSMEGIAADMEFGPLFVRLGHLWLEERSSETDTILHAAQVGFAHDLGKMKLTVGISMYDYGSINGQQFLFDTSDSFGNSSRTVGGNDVYANDFNLLEFFAELGSDKFSVYADYVANGEANSDDTAWLVGFKCGSKLKISYNYRKIEKDAVVGAYTDSDFKGGGTDGKGHELGLSQAVGKAKLALSHFMNKDSVTNGNDYHRTMLDFSLKF